MKMMNMSTRDTYPMRRVGPYLDFNGELVIDRSEQKIKWIAHAKIIEAILLDKPEVKVLGQLSEPGRRFLQESTIQFWIDLYPASTELSLLCEDLRIGMPERTKPFFGALEKDEPKGIFLPNGSVLVAVVKCPHAPEGPLKIRISVGADRYISGYEDREPQLSVPAIPSATKTTEEISEVIRKAEIEDWTMAMTANLIKHSVDCTTEMCLALNVSMPLKCKCGVGIRPDP